MDDNVKELLETIAYIVLGFIIAVGAQYGLSVVLDTNYPVVAVVSTSMEHDSTATFEEWFAPRNISQETLKSWRFSRGIQKGDIVGVRGVPIEEIRLGDVIVYQFPGRPPIIHRVVDFEDGKLITKGDNNPSIDQDGNALAPPIGEEQLQGRATVHIPLLGYVKITFNYIIGVIL